MNNTRWFYNYNMGRKIQSGNKAIHCTCGNRETITIDGKEEDTFQIRNIFPECKNCKTTQIGIKIGKYFINIIDQTKTSGDIEFYISDSGTKNEQLKANKLMRLKYDLIEPSLNIEVDGKMEKMKNKTQTKVLMKKLLSKDKDIISSGAIGELATGKSRDIVENLFNYNGDGGDKYFDFIHSRAVQALIGAGYSWNNIIFQAKYVNSEKTSPHEILEISKAILPRMKNWYFTTATFKIMQVLSEKYDGQDLQEGFRIADTEDFDLTIESLKNFFVIAAEEDVASFQKFARYVFIEAKHRQGIDDPTEVISLLNDSIHMAKEMELEYEVMPKSLKIMHDKLRMNYKVVKTAVEQKKFQEVVSDKKYTKLEYEGEKFKIVAPKSGDDLIREGKLLSHCVASYFDRVKTKKTKIYFLRNKEIPNAPLVTIEVSGTVVHQASGKGNRKLKEEEKEFVKEWAKENGLYA